MIVVQPDGLTSEIKPCSTGCTAPSADELVDFSDQEISDLLVRMQADPLGQGLAAETLLFHGSDTLDYLGRTSDLPLDHAREGWLRDELARDTISGQLRLLTADGQVIASIDPTFPLVEKQHLRMDAGDFGRVSINGKVKRVGVDHLWARF